ncbi:tRNA pseudouridine synthase B [Bacillus methanolicus PB1]|uniref:tRNA pseudouridine synthase B n=1 Tax=Bacillus methanolicus PB1 TaxID=997296 RepID=I3E4N5_BACMT|nr:tRNA pseudouridine(55) synthase TruB [Bacillus methanolicus]EIJ81456.1 tRNA pseudouridine synthase B [Bacillus methanolicus PB1]
MDGILPLFKPKGMTSHDCVYKLRKMLKIKKIGHTGTLDPDVNGVLPICIGKATKVAEYITEAGKTYEGEVTIGYSTTTEDASGDIVDLISGTKKFTREEIVQVLHTLKGEIVQKPPMYSAVKVNGKRLYEYARQGIEVERPSRKVTIYSIDLLDDRNIFEGETVAFRFRVTCSKGTYIRTLAVMIGEKLGYPAHMSDLIRIQSASFTLADSLTFEQIQAMIDDETISEALFPIEAALSHLPKYQLDDKVAEKVKNGAVLSTPKHLENLEGPVVFETKTGIALAIYKLHPLKKGFMKPEKVLKNI